MSRTAFQVEGPTLSISVKRDGLQLQPIAHADVQLASKSICKNPPTSGHLLRPTPAQPGHHLPESVQSFLPGLQAPTQPKEAKVPTKPGLCLSSCLGYPSPAWLSQTHTYPEEELPRRSGLAGTGVVLGSRQLGRASTRSDHRSHVSTGLGVASAWNQPP